MVRRYTKSLKMVGPRLENVTELVNCDEKGHDPTGNRVVRSDGPRDVGGSQTRIHHVPPLTNFKPAAPTSGEEMIKKRRFSPLVACMSLAGWCETDAGGIQLPT